MLGLVLFVLVAAAAIVRQLSRNCPTAFPQLRAGLSTLLVVAHPDDESLFFANYLTSAVRAGQRVHVLCLSTGNADGLGHIRKRELVRACGVLQIPASHVTVVDDPDLQDGFRTWDAAAVSSHVSATLQEIQPHELVTFDAGGVSGHPNHTSIHHAIRQMLEAGGAGGGDGAARRRRHGCRVYSLVTHPLLLKFSGPLGAALTLLLAPRPSPGGVAVGVSGGAAGSGRGNDSGGGDLLFATRNPALAFRAMCCHWSQFVWYRWLFMLFSTYTYINQLRPLGVLYLS